MPPNKLALKGDARQQLEAWFNGLPVIKQVCRVLLGQSMG